MPRPMPRRLPPWRARRQPRSPLRGAAAVAALALAGATFSPAARAQEPPPAAPWPPPGDAAQPGAAPAQPGSYPMPQLPPWANPRTIEYVDGDPIPPGYQLRTRADRGLAIGGVTVFGTGYLISLVIGTTVLMSDDSDSDTFAPLLVPVAGPFMAINTLDAEGSGVFWLMIDGLMQTAGVLMLAGAFASEDTYLKRQDVDGRASPPSRTRTRTALRPQVLVGPSAASLRWRF